MTGLIRVDTDRLSSVREQVNSRIRQIGTELGGIRENMQVMNSMWEGEAREAFRSACQEDLSQLETLAEELEQTVLYEENAAAEYGRCDREAAALVAAMKK